MTRLSDAEFGRLTVAMLGDRGAGVGGTRGARRWSVAAMVVALIFVSFAGISTHEGASSGSLVAMRYLNTPAASALVLSIVASPVAAQTAAVQWRVEDGGNGHWYSYSPVASTWSDSRAVAVSAGAHLATFTTEAEQSMAFSLASFPENQSVWIGLYQDLNAADYAEPANGWRWVTGEAISFLGWTYNSPNNNGGEDFGEWTPSWGGGWNDNLASAVRTALFEWSADCNSDGIVDYGQILAGELADANANNIPDCCEASAPCAVNLLANGGFEAGPAQANCSWVIVTSAMTNLAPWVVVAADVDVSRLTEACTNESWQSIEGEFSTDLDGWNTGGAIQQAISTVVGRQYLLTFELTGNCGGTAIRRMRATAGDGSADFMHACQPGGLQSWSLCQVPFTATTSTTAITLASLTPAGQSWGANGAVVDDVRVTRFDPPCPGDISGSGNVDGVDLTVLLGLWGTDGTGGEFLADITDDGVVDGADLTVVLGAWGACP